MSETIATSNGTASRKAATGNATVVSVGARRRLVRAGAGGAASTTEVGTEPLYTSPRDGALARAVRAHSPSSPELVDSAGGERDECCFSRSAEPIRSVGHGDGHDDDGGQREQREHRNRSAAAEHDRARDRADGDGVERDQLERGEPTPPALEEDLHVEKAPPRVNATHPAASRGVHEGEARTA